MKKISVLGKQIPAVLLALVAVAGIGSAAVLTYYGEITGTATVEQSVTLNTMECTETEGEGCSDTYTIGESPAVAGNTYTNGPMTIENNADNPITVNFGTAQEADYEGDGQGYVDASDAVITRYYGELVLENKKWGDISDPSTWSIVDDDINGSLKYYLDGLTFDYEFEATGLQTNTDYSLIYYADKPDRFEDWGGNNPGAVITEFTTDGNGDILLTSGSADLGIDLPSGDDANIDEYDYCESDDYNLCHGAKIWLVTSDDLTSNDLPVTWGNPDKYLFETDLISYHDGDDGGTGFTVYPGTMDFYIENSIDSNAMAGEYQVTTTIEPVTE